MVILDENWKCNNEKITGRRQCKQWRKQGVTSHQMHNSDWLPSTIDVNNVTAAALRLPAGQIHADFV